MRYGPGSNAIGLLQTLLVDGDGPHPRWDAALRAVTRHPVVFFRASSGADRSGTEKHRAPARD